MESAATDSRLQLWQVAWWVEDDFGQLGDVWVLVSGVNSVWICRRFVSFIYSQYIFHRAGMLAMVRPGDVWAKCWWSCWTLSRWASGIPISAFSELIHPVTLETTHPEIHPKYLQESSKAEMKAAAFGALQNLVMLNCTSLHGKRISIDDWRTVMSHDCVIQGLAPQQPFGTLPRQMLQRKWCSSCRILIRDGYWISVLQVHIALLPNSRPAVSKLEFSFVPVLTLYSFWPGGANEILATRRDCWRLPLADLALCRAACGVTVYTPWKTLN